MKHHVRCVVATMITALFFSSFNPRVLAMDSTIETQPIEVAFESIQTDKPIEETLIQEIEDKREANVKHFLTDQFNYVAMVYPLSVHYWKLGCVWVRCQQ